MSTNRSADTSHHNTQNSKNHNPHVSVQGQMDTIFKATRPSSAEAFYYSVPAESTIGPNFLQRIVFSDEYVFHVSRIVNNKNARLWPTKNPRLVQENQLRSAKITVWCFIHANGVLDPYYFDNETGRGADYYELLNTCERSSRHSFPQTYLLYHDRAPAYK